MVACYWPRAPQHAESTEQGVGARAGLLASLVTTVRRLMWLKHGCEPDSPARFVYLASEAYPAVVLTVHGRRRIDVAEHQTSGEGELRRSLDSSVTFGLIYLQRRR